MAVSDRPVLCWHNLLAGATYTVTAGTELAGAAASEAASGDTLRPAQIEADPSGAVEVVYDTPPAIGYGEMPFGFGPFGGVWRIEAIVLGAHRHQSAGWRTEGLTWSVQDQTIEDIWAGSEAAIIRPETPIDPGAQITVRATGAVPGQPVTIPELYVGPVIEMPYLDLGYDPYHEVTSAGAYRAESGREYLTIRYRRLELTPRWSVVPASLWAELDHLREEVIEQRRVFWFAWAPLSAPTEVYLVRHSKPSASMPIRSAVHRAMALQLVESI